MKVLVVANGVPNGANSLDGIFEFDQAKALADAGVDVTFFGVDLRSIRHLRRVGITNGKQEGIEWYKISIPLGSVPLKWFCFIGGIALSFLYKRVFRRATPPDIIHAHFTEQGFMAESLSNRNRVPLVVTEHSSQIMKRPIRDDYFKLAKTVYRQANCLITVSNALAKKIKEEFKIDSIVIPNIIDVDLFRSTIKVTHQGFNVVVVAGLVSGKRIDKLIETVSKLKSEIPNIYLHIIGDGPIRQELEKKTREFHISDSTKFYGALTRDRIANVFSICDCFALLSASETFGVVYVEAMAAGLPVVATRCGGPEGFVNNKNGIMVNVDNIEEAANALKYIYYHKTDYESDSIRDYARDNFSPQSVASQLVDVYKKLLNNGEV